MNVWKIALISTSLPMLAMALAAAPAAAESAGSANPAAADASAPEGEIVVTATKRAESINKVPMSITAASGDQLRNQNITSLQDLSRAVPGLTFVDTGQSTPVYSLRGIGFFDYSLAALPAVSVYVDEVPLPFGVMTQGASLDIERVEVLKGPQGTLFGSNSTGGAINYVAAKPTQHLEAGFYGSYGRFDQVDLQGYLSGPITENLRARIAVERKSSGPWQQSYTRHDELGRTDVTIGRILAEWTPTPSLTLRLNANGFIDRSDTLAGQLIGVLYATPSQAAQVPLLSNYPRAPANDRAADWDPGVNLARDNRFGQVSLRTEYVLSREVQLISLTSYSSMHAFSRNDSDGTALLNYRFEPTGRLNSFSQEVRAQVDLDRMKAIVGANYSRNLGDENQYAPHPYSTGANSTNAFGAPFLDQGNLSDQLFHNYAAFLNADYKILDEVTAHGGVRYTKSTDNYYGCSYTPDDIGSRIGVTGIVNAARRAAGQAPLGTLPAGACYSFDGLGNPGPSTGKLSEHNVSWRGGVDWAPSTTTLLYANVSKGYKAGSAPALAGILISAFKPVVQESVISYEAGFKLGLFSRALQLNGAVFYSDYRNKQLLGRVFTNPNIFGAQAALVNVPKSYVEGAELQIDARPVRNLRLSGGVTYIKSKVTSDFNNFTIIGTAENFKGNAFPYTPKWEASGDAEYQIPVSDTYRGFVGGSIDYRSSTKAGFGTSPYLDIDSYALLDLRAGFEKVGGDWRVTLFAKNITNKYYWTNVAKFSDAVRRLPGMPATYGVSVAIKYR